MQLHDRPTITTANQCVRKLRYSQQLLHHNIRPQPHPARLEVHTVQQAAAGKDAVLQIHLKEAAPAPVPLMDLYQRIGMSAGRLARHEAPALQDSKPNQLGRLLRDTLSW